ncbi:MAG: DUF294 nucleotidyltransferase-like domain-containing protein [Thiofilum sp.]|nr:CBS domain-containing protein [Thiofilum sp.]
MQEELVVIRDFIASCPPFDQLAEPALTQLTPQWVIRYLRRGSAFPPHSTPHYWLIRRGAIEIRDADNQLLEKLAEGDSYSADCLSAPSAIQTKAHTSEDTLLYALPLPALAALWQQHPTLHQLMLADLGQRIAHAHQRVLPSIERNLLSLALKDLLHRPAVSMEADTPLQTAAQYMVAQRVSALLVTQDQRLCGILTDRDLRSRALAQGLAFSTPISAIMTPNPLTLSPEQPCADALTLMTERGIHHLPISLNGELYGLVSSSDLLQLQSRNSLYLADRMRRSPHRESLISLAHELPELWFSIAQRGENPLLLGRLISTIADTLTQRLLVLAEQQLGEPPIPYAWIAYGSQGRHELTLHSDQDNALILADSYDVSQHGSYFEQLTRYVCEGLAASGFILCPGNMMAMNPQWRLPVQAWLDLFADWIYHTDAHKARLATNLFDLRYVAGSADLVPLLRTYVEEHGASAPLQHYLAHNTATPSVQPLGFFRHYVLTTHAENTQLDLKPSALLPLISLARIYALNSASSEVNTVARFQWAAHQGLLSASGAQELIQAFALALNLRTQHQVQQYAQGLALTNVLSVQTLSTQDKQALRDVFKLIALHQHRIRQAYLKG